MSTVDIKKVVAMMPVGCQMRLVEHIQKQQTTVLKQCAELSDHDQLMRAQGGYKQLEWILGWLDAPKPVEQKRAVSRREV